MCPWQRELLSCLLQADVLGFHTLYHCHNLLDTVDRAIECKIDREHMTVTLQRTRLSRGAVSDINRMAAALVAGAARHRRYPGADSPGLRDR